MSKSRRMMSDKHKISTFNPSSKDVLTELWEWDIEQIQASVQTNETDPKMLIDLPTSRVKKIMKSDPNVRMISAEAPLIVAKLCESFIWDLTVRSCLSSPDEDISSERPNGIGKSNIQEACRVTPHLDFLREIIGTPGHQPTQPSIFET